jgi:hypothetical protein
MMNHSNPDEVGAALRGEIGRCALRAAEEAATLESVAERSFELSTSISRDAHATDLRRVSDAMRGVVLQALSTVAEIQRIAGRLSTCAALRAAEEAQEPEGAGIECARNRRR